MDRTDGAPASTVGEFDIPGALREVDAALKAALLRYAEQLPPDLITMGKMALHARGKVMAWSRAQETGAEALLPRWPLFVLFGCRAALPAEERGRWREAIPAAVAVEIAIAAADLIDEWSDGDDSPVIEQYGPGQAINVANLMLVMAQQVLVWEAQRPGGNAYAGGALGALQDMLVEAAVGQHLDMAYEHMPYRDVTPEMSGQMTEKKAGALIGGACRMGALMTGADEEVTALVWRFGRQVGGMAQLANDIQDVLPHGTEVVTPDGSGALIAPPKTDLARRKRTLPIVFALRDEAAEPNAVQRAYAGGPGAEGIDEDAMRRAVMEAGGVNFAHLVLDVYRNNATEALDALEAVRPGARDVLSPLLGG
ncbi:MAG TPA: polyprenyl synthetase family protein [Chloroflexia bacterium]|nr:polyprenyl synthetase family protein [Chloroflexia bacterium]